MKHLTVMLVVLCLQLPMWACLNDRDTLAEEAKAFPDVVAEEVGVLPGVVQAVTGRFPRNPPLYYEMRIKRVAQELKANPQRLDLYDDAGVACDRIGRSDEAIVWMQKKLSHLKQANANGSEVREHWYRYHANLGTFQAHRWIRAGANRANINEMEQARDNIRKAVQIKPNAHFGREKYQLKAMEWIIDPSASTKSYPMPDFLGLVDAVPWDETKTLKKLGYEDAVKGLTGLITLGNAWESLDVFYELGIVLLHEKKGTLAYLASLRGQELLEKGRRSLNPGAPTGNTLKMYIEKPYVMSAYYPTTDRPEQLKRFYQFARAEAEDYQKRRTNYMVERLQAGLHPDTDPTFWNNWHDAGPPSPSIMKSWWFNNPWAVPLLQSSVALIVASLLLLWVGRKKRHAPAVA